MVSRLILAGSVSLPIVTRDQAAGCDEKQPVSFRRNGCRATHQEHFGEAFGEDADGCDRADARRVIT